MPLAIVHYNSAVLRQKGAPVAAFDADLARLAADMIATMHAARGIGLAAQQIGRALQFCVIDLRDTDRDFYWELDGVQTPLDLIMPMALANPVVEVLPSEKTIYEEGCLSFPEIHGDVARPDRVRVTYQDTRARPIPSCATASSDAASITRSITSTAPSSSTAWTSPSAAPSSAPSKPSPKKPKPPNRPPPEPLVRSTSPLPQLFAGRPRSAPEFPV